MRDFVKNNSLSIAFLSLFVVCLLGQAVAGYWLQFENPAGDGAPVDFFGYLTKAEFLEGIFVNWQAALLQLLALIVFAIFLRQRGAAHSRKPEHEAQKRPPGLERAHFWLYGNSLSLAFLALFLGSFTAHLFAGLAQYNGERAREHETIMTVGQFLTSSKFWFQTLQTWEAEFFAIAAYLVFSIYLRQESSAESKPVDASNEDTGETNE